MSVTSSPPGSAKPVDALRPARHTGPFVPKSVVCLIEGYGRAFFFNDLIAGITVGIIALPLAMALAIASGVTPERGLYTAIVAGFLISALGGSRVQVGGPTGAFVVIVAGIVAKHGYEGLAIATLMAGAILILMGIARFGGMIKFIPYPVTTGFTSGIAVLIFSTQVQSFFGIAGKPTHEGFASLWGFLLSQVRQGLFSWSAVAVGGVSLALLIVLRKFAPRVPGALVAVVLASVAVGLFSLDTRYGVETIGSRFGGIPRMLPTPSLPFAIDGWASVGAILLKAKDLIPEATTIALLAAIESLLCAVVSDGMIGGRHKSDCELVAQGIANIGSIAFGGIPATGAIARTAANVKSGARTPLAGMIHSVTLLAFMLLLAPYASKVPLAALAAVLMVVAWNMSELDHFRTLLRAPRSDIVVLLTTFLLTVIADLTVAVGVGMVLAAMLFMKRMSEVTNVGAIRSELDDTDDRLTDEGTSESLDPADVPDGVEVFEINGPFFFGVADRLQDTLRGIRTPPKVFILRMRRVPAIDATGMHALEEFVRKCKRQGTRLLLSGVHAQPMFALTKYGLIDEVGEENLCGTISETLELAREIVGDTTAGTKK